MKYLALGITILLFACQSPESSSPQSNADQLPIASDTTSAMEWSIAIHGGAGNFTSEDISPEQELEYERNLQEALQIGEDILKSGGSSLDAVEATIHSLENCPLFNAGKGAVFTSEGINEMDASIMDGKDLNCGSVTGIQNVKNPISAARKVMENSEHVFFSGKGATSFAREQGLEMVDSSYFFTERRWNSYLRVKERTEKLSELREQELKFGTVGCVALDKEGNLAAGTSTGGMTYKNNGRIGDSPVISAGTYADNNSCAISCTGHGEYFIRAAVAHDICVRMEYKKISLEAAAKEVVQDKLVEMGGDGGIIGVDSKGNVAMVFNTSGMFRAFSNSNLEKEIYMYK